MSLLYCVARTVAELSDCVKTNYIKTRYFTQEGMWYHLSPKHFVNVLLIHHMEQGGDKEIVDIAVLMREGLSSHCQLSQFNKAQSINTISTHDISDIFKPFKRSDGTTIIAEVIIIDGAPGMGKTTLSKEIAYRWANSQLLDDTKLVFFVYLRDPEIQKIRDLESFIHYFKNYDQAAASFSKQCANILINRSNDDVTIILDGYDEYFDASGDSFINRIINRKVFAKSKLIITSRPTATDRLQHIGDIRVEVMGFTDDSKKEYIKQELKNYPDKMEKLFSYLNNHQTINSICYIPMIMTILVCTFREIEELPSDQTELYEKFITLAISRYVEKLENKPNPTILPLKHLPELYKNFLFELSKFAFHNLKDDKIVFTAEDIEKFCPELSSANKNFQGLGLLKSTQYFSMKKIDNCVSYNFLHLSLQEYLAAYYINLLNPCKQFELLKNSFFVEKYTNSWIMFTRLSKKAIFDLLNYSVYGIPCNELRNKLLPHISNLNQLEAFSQAAKICANERVLRSSKLLCFKNSEVKCHEDILLSSVDDIALLNKLNFTLSEFKWNKLYLSLRNTNGNIMEGFVIDKNSKETLYCKIASELYTEMKYSVVIVNVSTLIGYRANKQQVSDGLAMNDSITTLIMRTCHIGDETAEIISCCIKASNLKTVIFANCTFNNSASKITFESLSSISSLRDLVINNTIIDDVAVASVIKSNSGIQMLYLGNNKLGAGALKIVRALKEVSSLKVLDLNDNNTSGIIADFLASAISSNSSLEDLRLSNNRLTTSGTVTIAKSLSNMSTLKYLEIQSNLITEEAADSIVSVIKSNTGIEELYLGNNKLGVGALKIVTALNEVSSLKVVDLDNNNTSGIIANDLTAVIDHNSLQKLWLANNDLRSCASTILQSLSKITTLTELDLSGNGMSEEVTDFLASAISSNSSLEYLGLSDNRLTISGIVTIAKSLSNISTLKHLSAKSNLISEEAADSIASVIKSNTGIEELYLGNNKLGAGALKIIRALKEVSSLKVLDLNNNNTSGIIADDLAAVIDHNSLQILWLANNDLRSCASTILQSLSKITTLLRLNLSDNNMSEEVADFLAFAIASNSSLEDLILRDNRLTTSGIVTIAKSLSIVSTLKYLSVTSNLISEEAADSIASVIKSNTGIEELYLGNNKLGAGALKIVRALKEVSSLKVLDLNNNNTSGIIADDLAAVIDHNSLQILWLANNDLRSCASTILQSLSKITTLLRLNLSDNNMSEEVADFLAFAIASNSSLEDLILRDNRLTTSGIVTIAKSLSNISTLKYLSVTSNLISEEAADSIASVIKSNTGIEELYLGNNKLGAGALKIVRALKEVSSLKVLDLTNNNISGIIADDLVAVIDHNSLQILWLANNDLRSCASTILQSLSKITTLTELDLSGNNMSEEVADFLAFAISSNSSLEDLRLSNNRLKTNGIITIVKSLSKLSRLKVLDISNILITKEAAVAVVSVISKINTLTSLYLGNCYMSDEVANDLAAAIRSNCSLEVLQLKNNQLKTSGVMTICQSLQQLSTLTYFNIRNNRITEEAAECIASVILSNNRIQQLFLGDNILHNKIVVIIRALQSVSSLVLLYLNNMKMTEEVAGDLVLAINNNPLLKELYLAGNLLSSSLIEVAKACKKSTKHLITLDLQCNCVDPSKMTDLTSVIRDINTLEALLLGGLSMSTVDQMFDKFLCHLEILNLHGTKVDLESFEEYRHFEMLNMEIQNSSIAHTAKLNYQLSHIPYDTTYTLHIDLLNPQQVIDQHSFLYNLEKVKHKVNATIMIQSLSVISTLKVVDLEHNNVDETAAFELATKLHSNNVLQQLWLRGNQLNTAGAMFILNSLEYMSTLQVLDLSFNNIGYQSADNVAAVIYSNPTLEQLWLDGNGLLDTGVVQICRALKHVFKLRILSLCSNGISDDSAEELSVAIFSNDLLEDLLLGNNNLQSVGICKIVHSLNNLVRLRKLDLFHNGVTKEVADELAVTMSNCYTLQELYLSDNMLGTIGALKIFESLKHKSKLQVLTLSNNNITDEVIGELCFVLARNPRLQVLLIGGNKLQTDGVITIAGVVKCENIIMSLLALCENYVSEQGKEQVKMMFSDNPDIHVYV